MTVATIVHYDCGCLGDVFTGDACHCLCDIQACLDEGGDTFCERCECCLIREANAFVTCYMNNCSCDCDEACNCNSDEA